MLDVLMNKSYRIQDYTLVLDTIQRNKSHPLHCMKLAATTIKVSITTLESVIHNWRQIAIVCQNYSCELSKLQLLAIVIIFFEIHGYWYMILLRLIAIECQNYSCQQSKLQLLAIVIKMFGAIWELVHDTFNTDCDCMPKLQLPAIKTIAASYSKKKWLRGNWYMILSRLIVIVYQNYASYLNYSCELQ